MIQHNTQYQSDIHPRLAMLHRRYHELSHRLSTARPYEVLSSATFIPSAGQSIAFERPIAPVGSVLLCQLAYEPNDDERMTEAGYCFTGYRGRYLDQAAESLWESEPWFDFSISDQTYATEHDERLMRSPRFLDTLVGLGQLALRMSEHERNESWRLTLPATLLGFDPDEQDLVERLMAGSTQWVRFHARTSGMSIPQAWQSLDAATRVDGDIEMTGLRLVDARLCADVETGTGHLPPILTTYHDLRQLLGRRTMNPIRKLMDTQVSELMALVDEQQDHARAVQRLRRLMFRDVADGSTDEDLLKAIRDPEGPLYTSKIARRQVW